MASIHPSNDELAAAVREIRQAQPNIGRAKIRDILRGRYQWQISKARLKDFVPAANTTSEEEEDDDPLRPFWFWVNEAHKNADARSLVEELGLDIPQGDAHGYKSGLMYPMRRLVVTGKDDPENMRILFGVDSIPDLHARVRRDVLMSFAVQDGSPMQMVSGYMDEGCPHRAPKPLAPDETLF